jgi:hypothetical protein
LSYGKHNKETKRNKKKQRVTKRSKETQKRKEKKKEVSCKGHLAVFRQSDRIRATEFSKHQCFLSRQIDR